MGRGEDEVNAESTYLGKSLDSTFLARHHETLHQADVVVLIAHQLCPTSKARK
jgi:hypothetical protein